MAKNLKKSFSSERVNETSFITIRTFNFCSSQNMNYLERYRLVAVSYIYWQLLRLYELKVSKTLEGTDCTFYISSLLEIEPNAN